MTLRIPLKPGTEITFTPETHFVIKNESGRGSSCVVYDAYYRTNAGDKKTVRIKECYPYDLNIKRDDNGNLIVSKRNALQFESAKKRMYTDFRLCNHLFNIKSASNNVINTINIYEANNTVYMISTWSGIVLTSLHPDSLLECITIVQQTAYAIQNIHEAGFLYLDIKPENILIIDDPTKHVQLFDFDSLIPLSQINDGSSYKLSYTRGFSAPELYQGDLPKLGFHTDVYGIGSLLFYLLFDRTPDILDCESGAKYDFSVMKFASQTPNNIRKLLSDFFRKTLAVYPLDRWQNMTDVIHVLEIIYKAMNQYEGDYKPMNFERKLVLNTDWCKGCGICVAFCPKSVLAISNDKVFLQNEEKCIFCGQCEMRCPDYAIFIREGIEVNDQWAKPY